MTIYNWLCLLGIPAVMGSLIMAVWSKVKKTSGETKALMLGIQALLRDRLYQLYRFCDEKGYASLPERENFENMYTQYHALGGNGVITNIRNKFQNLPTK